MRYQTYILGLVLILLMAGAAVAMAAAVDLGYPPFTQATGPADFIQKLYDYALSIAGTLAVVMIVYGGVKYVVSAGSVSAQSDARDIIKNAVWGIVLLAGAYLVLNTINPRLVNLSENEPGIAPITAAPTSTSTTPPPLLIPDTVLEEMARLAQLVLSHPNIRASGDASCEPLSDAASVLNSVARKTVPKVCSNGCTKTSGCVFGGVSGEVNLQLSLLHGILDSVTEFDHYIMVTSLTGGDHASGSLHYHGRAADFVLTDTTNPGDWSTFTTVLMSHGASRAVCEVGGSFVNCYDLFDASGNLKSGAHIHAEW
jgi:hypothetical protein